MATPHDFPEMKRDAKPVLDGGPWSVGGGEMGELIRSMDWTDTPLGPIEDWPTSLRTTVNLSLASNFPINIVWGSHYNQIYNDGYRVVVGERHPQAMGMPYDECWASAWPAIGKPFESAWKGKTSFIENQRMYVTRNGYLEETFFTFSLSPIRDERGVIVGLFHPVTETTAKMLGERRTGALRAFATDTSEARTVESALALGVDSLGAQELDLPFVLLYSLSEDGREAHLVKATGIARGLKVSPEVVDLAASDNGWPLAAIVGTRKVTEINELQKRFGEFGCGHYPEGARSAMSWAVHIPGVALPLGILVVGISPRLPMNEAYGDYLYQLTTVVAAALVNALAYEQERKRAELLAELANAKIQFFSNVSHEFRTPLALLLGPVESVLATGETELSARNREQIDIVRRNSFRLLKLVNNLLDFSRIEAGRVKTNFASTNLSSWTSEVVGNFRSGIEAAGVSLVVDCPPLGEEVYVDRDLWERIVLNLVSNAFKFTMRGRINVSLGIVGDRVELAVSDTGCGIPADQLSRVFERFHRVEGVEARTYEGSGIGLALVDEFVRMHQGSVSVESTEGVGSRFIVTIPRGSKHLSQGQILDGVQHASQATPHESYTEEASWWSSAASVHSRQRDLLSSSSETGSQPKSPGKTRRRILLVEDNADMRSYILGVIGDEYEIEAVGNGEEALASIANSAPDLVLSDVMMPRMDGFALLRRLRSDAKTQGLPIILLSARAGEEARVEGIEGGADDYLVKPFSLRELRARVRTQIELHELRSELAVKRELIRTADALRQSEKLAIVGRLASSIAHEINNPLAAVINLLYLSETSPEPEQARKYVQRAQAELVRVANITTQTLRFHRQAKEAQQISLHQVLDNVLTLFQGRPEGVKHGIERQYRSERPILAFEADLRQVFANLVSNALDAIGPAGRIVLRVQKASDAITGKAGVRVTVADNGHGMAEETRKHIFEPFFTTKGLTGTGLGLWVSSGILQRHEAKVRVRSSQSPTRHGAIFSIFFPVDRVGSFSS